MDYINNKTAPRGDWGPYVVYILIGLNLAIFLIGQITLGVEDGMRITVGNYMLKYGALMPLKGMGNGYNFGVWQYITYQFLHGGMAHIFMNMLGLWMFGTEISHIWGGRRFLVYYLLCGIGAGLVHSVVMLITGDGAPTVGASGAIYGVLVAFAMMFPDRIVLMGFFIPMRAKYAVLVFAALELYNGVTGSVSGVAHFAHLGGALVGFILIKIGGVMTLGGIFDKLPWGNRRKVSPGSPTSASGSRMINVQFRDVQPQPPRQQTQAPQMPVLRGDEAERINAILDRITHVGYNNLTPEEKQLLDQISRRMNQK